MSYASTPGEVPLLGKTVGQLIDEAAQKYGDFPACYEEVTGTTISFRQLKMESEKIARGLLSLGLKPGDRVGIWGHNSLRWVVVFMACTKVGLIPVCINPVFQAQELLYSLNKVGVKSLVFGGKFKNQDPYKILLEIVPEFCQFGDSSNFTCEKVPTLESVVSMEDEPVECGIRMYRDLLTEHDETTMKESCQKLADISNLIQFDDVCSILFTSGSSGRSKGVMLSHHNLVNGSFFVGKQLGMIPTDRLCLPVSIFHGFGNICALLASIHFGACVIFPSKIYSPSAAIQVSASQRATMLYATPTMLIDIVNHPNLPSFNLDTLRVIISGGANLPINLVQELQSKFPVRLVINLHGMTESCPLSFQLHDRLSDEPSTHFPQHCEVKVVDQNGKIVPLGVEGEMCIRGYVVMQGYWDDPVNTSTTIDSSRWLHTSDMVNMGEDRNGWRIIGRLGDMINRGGENIYPSELEDFLHTHPFIQEAHVFGVYDQRLGQVVAAWIKRDGEKRTRIDVEDIKEFCRGKISEFKIPTYIKFTDEFPRTSTGKVPKYILRQLYSAELGLASP